MLLYLVLVRRGARICCFTKCLSAGEPRYVVLPSACPPGSLDMLLYLVFVRWGARICRFTMCLADAWVRPDRNVAYRA